MRLGLLNVVEDGFPHKALQRPQRPRVALGTCARRDPEGRRDVDVSLALDCSQDDDLPLLGVEPLERLSQLLGDLILRCSLNDAGLLRRKPDQRIIVIIVAALQQAASGVLASQVVHMPSKRRSEVGHKDGSQAPFTSPKHSHAWQHQSPKLTHHVGRGMRADEMIPHPVARRHFEGRAESLHDPTDTLGAAAEGIAHMNCRFLITRGHAQEATT